MILFLLFISIIGGLFVFNSYLEKRAEVTYPPNGKFVTVDGLKLHYIMKGTGKPIVFLHGGVYAGNDYNRLIDLAAALGFQAISFDRPGYGYSERAKMKAATPVEQARLIHKAITKIQAEKPIIAGHSMSGTIALSLALGYPNDISGIILIGANAMYNDGNAANSGHPLSKLAAIPLLGNVILAILLGLIKRVFARILLKTSFEPERAPAGYVKTFTQFGMRFNQLKSLLMDADTFYKTAGKISARYHEITIPAIVMIGENDPLGSVEQAKRLKGDISHAHFIVLSNAAHMLPQNHPDLVMDAINHSMSNGIFKE